MNFDKLIGEKAVLYYCNEANCFQLGSVIFEVLENPDDGYRSYLDTVVVNDPCAKITHKLADITICHMHSNGRNLYRLTDSEGKDWVEFGTEDYDDYYPCFVFRTNY